MPIKAYSYVRFSTSEQIKGDSLRRQTELSTSYVKEHNLVLDTSLNLNDLGVPAFKGKNVEEGRLGAFIKAVEDGQVKQGSYLLIENLDRLSRERVPDALTLFLSILKMGIVIVTLSDKKKYEYSTIDTTDLIISLTVMTRAHEESKRKGELVKAAWDNKREHINKKKLTKWSPKWLNLSEDRTHFVVDDERVKIIRQIYEWSAFGYGTNLIIQRLEEMGVKPWDMGNIKRNKRLAKKWHSGIIQRFLTDRTVLGEYRLRKANADDGYEIIKDYYPQIIDEGLFYSVQEARKSRNVSNKGGGRRGKTLSNLFSKLAICGYSLDNNMGQHRCAGSNEVMVYVNKGKRYPIKYLQCSRNRNGNTGCEKCKKLWRYDYFETSFLTHIKDIDASVIVGTTDESKHKIDLLQEKITTEKGKLIYAEERIKGLGDALKKHRSIPDFMIEEGSKLEKEKKGIKKQLDLLKSELKSEEYEYKNSNRKIQELSYMIDAMEALEGQELFDLRLQLSELLKRVINRIEVYPKGRVVDERYIERIEEELGFEAAETMRRSEEQANDLKLVLPFYVVVYRSGERRMVIVNPKDPTDLLDSVKWDDEAILELSKKWGMKPRS